MPWRIPDQFPDASQMNGGQQVTESTPCTPELFNALVTMQLYYGGDTDG